MSSCLSRPGLRSDLIFTGLFLLLSFLYYNGILDKGPLNTHIWRQADCISLTSNYSTGNSFANPEMNILLADGYSSGKSAGEFPFFYYLVGKIWSLTGESFLVYRLTWLLILFAGLFAFYRSVFSLLKDHFWAISLAMLLFTSPVYITYGVSFLTDVPAFSFVLLALWFLLKYEKKHEARCFFISMGFFALSGLIKVSGLIAFFFLLFIFLLEIFPFRALGDRKLFSRKPFEWVGFILVFLVVIAWYYYAHLYNAEHQFKYTFNDIMPVWTLQGNEGSTLLNDIREFSSQVFFSEFVLYLMGLLFFFNLFLKKYLPPIAWWANVIVAAGCVIYFMLWAPLMGIHDYYFVAMLILFPAIILPFLYYIITAFPSIMSGRKTRLFFGVFFLFVFLQSFSVVQLKFGAEHGDHIFIRNPEFVIRMKSRNSLNRVQLEPYYKMRGFLEKIGVGEDDRVISLPDESFNATLVLSGRKGWTNFHHYSESENIRFLIGKGAEFLFVSDSTLLESEFLQPFLLQPVGEFEGVSVFRLDRGM